MIKKDSLGQSFKPPTIRFVYRRLCDNRQTLDHAETGKYR